MRERVGGQCTSSTVPSARSPAPSWSRLCSRRALFASGPTTSSEGIETAVATFLSPHITARATYSFHDARFRDFTYEFDPGVPTQLAGKRLEMSARHLASVGATYAAEHGAVLGMELNYVGSSYLNKRNTALADGYVTVSASVGYRIGKYELRLDGRNLTDNRSPVAESELGDAQYYRMTARRFDLTLAYRF